MLNVDYLLNKDKINKKCKKIIYTGPIDALFNYSLGVLQYRSLKFVQKNLLVPSYQDYAIINNGDHNTPYTRVYEHKKFLGGGDYSQTVITEEYPDTFEIGKEPFYPINDKFNNSLAKKYRELANAMGILIGGRLGSYQYYNMDQVVAQALKDSSTI